MKLKKNIALSDSGFVFDPGNGNSFTTNPIGLLVIQFLKQGKSAEEIRSLVLNEYDIDAVTFGRDLNDFTNVLSKLKLTEDNAKKKD